MSNSIFETLEAEVRRLLPPETIASFIRTAAYRNQTCDALLRLKATVKPPDLAAVSSEASWRQEDERGLCFALLLPRPLLLLPLLRAASAESSKRRAGQRWAFVLGAPLLEPTAGADAADVRAALLARCAANIVQAQGGEASLIHSGSTRASESFFEDFCISCSFLHANEGCSPEAAMLQIDSQLSSGASKILVAREQLGGRLRNLTKFDGTPRNSSGNDASPKSSAEREESSYGTLLCANIVGRPSLEALKQQRRAEVEAAMLDKEEPAASGDIVDRIAAASLTFDLLAKAPQEEVNQCGLGLRTIYNYVRLRAILEKFEARVEEGRYPPLPPLEEMQALTESDRSSVEEMWGLAWMFLDRFKSLLEELGPSRSPNCLGLKLSAHKLCHFLATMSQRVSQFYNRRRILINHPTPSESQLRIMHTRLHVIGRLKALCEFAFSLLGVPLLDRM